MPWHSNLQTESISSHLTVHIDFSCFIGSYCTNSRPFITTLIISIHWTRWLINRPYIPDHRYFLSSKVQGLYYTWHGLNETRDKNMVAKQKDEVPIGECGGRESGTVNINVILVRQILSPSLTRGSHAPRFVPSFSRK